MQQDDSDFSNLSDDAVSALMDGQLRGRDFSAAVLGVTGSASARQSWDCYHLVGEVMRSGHASARAHDADMVSRLRQKIADEAIQLIAVSADPISENDQKHAQPSKPVRRLAANDRWWRLSAGLAAFALLAVLVWQGAPDGVPSGAQLAQSSAMPEGAASLAGVPASASAPRAQAGPVGPMLRDAQLDALLAAHRQLGGGSALQMSSGFLRNATFDGDGR